MSRRRLRAGCALASILLLAGCLRSKETVRLELDGTGTVQQRFVVDLARRSLILEALCRLAPRADLQAPTVFADPWDPRWIEAVARRARGYQIQDVDSVREEGRRTTTVRATFDSLRSAARAQAFFPSRVELGRRPGENTWTLEIVDGWSAWGDVARDELAGRPAQEVVRALQAGLAGLSLERVLTLPTDVVETNAELDPDGRTVRWTTDYADLAGVPERRITIRFLRAPELELAPFRDRPDPELLVQRLFEPPPAARARTAE